MENINDKIEALSKEIREIKEQTENDRRRNAILLRLGNLLADDLNDSKERISDGIDTLKRQLQEQLTFVKENQALVLKKSEELERVEAGLRVLCERMAKSLVDLQNDMMTRETRVVELEKRIFGIHDVLNGIKAFLQEETQSSQRLKEGYDFQILKNFVRQICREIHNLEKEIRVSEEPALKEQLQFVLDSLKEILDRNSISAITINVGEPYRGHEEIAECLQERVKTDEASLDGKIAEITREGFIYRFNDGQERVLEPAKVKLYECPRIAAPAARTDAAPAATTASALHIDTGDAATGGKLPLNGDLSYNDEEEKLAEKVGVQEDWQTKTVSFVQKYEKEILIAVLFASLILNVFFVLFMLKGNNQTSSQPVTTVVEPKPEFKAPNDAAVNGGAANAASQKATNAQDSTEPQKKDTSASTVTETPVETTNPTGGQTTEGAVTPKADGTTKDGGKTEEKPQNK